MIDEFTKRLEVDRINTESHIYLLLALNERWGDEGDGGAVRCAGVTVSIKHDDGVKAAVHLSVGLSTEGALQKDGEPSSTCK